jgi:hypothetical protein
MKCMLDTGDHLELAIDTKKVVTIAVRIIGTCPSERLQGIII